jgi:hypothetical protein
VSSNRNIKDNVVKTEYNKDTRKCDVDKKNQFMQDLTKIEERKQLIKELSRSTNQSCETLFPMNRIKKCKSPGANFATAQTSVTC